MCGSVPRLVLWCLASVILASVACGPARSPSVAARAQEKKPPPEEVQAAAEASDPLAVGELTIGEPVSHANLTVFPILAKAPREDDRFITLDEGLKAGTIEILEVGAQAAASPSSDDPFGAAAPANAPQVVVPQAASPDDDPFGPAAPGEPNEAPDLIEEAPPPNSPADDPFGEPAPASPSPGDDPFGALSSFDNAGAGGDQVAQVAGGRGNDVNQLLVVNNSGKPLYLMPGEIIVGGDQDRVIGGELVIQPDGKPTPINVFCVEHGRWGQRSQSETIAYLTDAADDPFGEPAPASPSPGDDPFGALSSFDNAGAGGDQVAQVAGGRGNDVNQLLVVNKSGKPLYLMPGEIIVGGDQDRVIGGELVIQPDGKPTPINVFCVEHGRWGQRSQSETIAYLSDAAANEVRGASVAIQAPTDAEADGDGLQAVAQEANAGKFIASVGSLNKGSRLAVQSAGDQTVVWNAVAQENARSRVEVASGAFTANYVQGEAVARLEPYLERFEQPIGKTDRIVGVVVAINGKAESLDVFESTPLFRKLWPKLLKSYALDAVNAAPDGEGEKADDAAPAAECTRQSARDFLAKAIEGDGKEDREGTVALTTRDSDEVISFAAQAAVDDSMSMDGGGFGGGGIHISGFAK